MTHNQTASKSIPYGAWPSPITEEMLTGQTIGLGEPGTDTGSSPAPPREAATA